MHRSPDKRHSVLHLDAMGIGLCAAACIAFYVVTVQPVLRQQSLLAGQYRDLQAEQANVVELKDSVATAQKRLETVQQELATSSIQLDSAAHINRRIAGLTQFFSDCDLQVDDVQTGRVCSGRQYDLIPISILGRGGYVPCTMFLHKLCIAFPDMSVITVELNGSPAQASSGTFRLDLYWYAACSPRAPTASPERPQPDGMT